MNKLRLIEKCEVLEKVIVAMSKVYNSANITSKQKDLMETMVGAAIWYLPSGDELYSGMISEKALKLLVDGTPLSWLTAEHRFPRKIAGKILLSEKYRQLESGRSKLIDLYMDEFGIFNLVERSENKALVKHQRGAAFINGDIAYKLAGISLVSKPMGELKMIDKQTKAGKKTQETNNKLD
ncbi:MAG TPA: hypothetical protein PLV06_14675 [Bacteroidales bacterium]|nr:hypothetical protein [Bacteroidales bacterium]